mmetsp:Transcript_43831/g.98588  ORF Transcript_43831/g.98588 Transcript_43831/m.98588 type:complete len:228 (-) Transcript_43831:311-994(-)
MHCSPGSSHSSTSLVTLGSRHQLNIPQLSIERGSRNDRMGKSSNDSTSQFFGSADTLVIEPGFAKTVVVVAMAVEEMGGVEGGGAFAPFFNVPLLDALAKTSIFGSSFFLAFFPFLVSALSLSASLLRSVTLISCDSGSSTMDLLTPSVSSKLPTSSHFTVSRTVDPCRVKLAVTSSPVSSAVPFRQDVSTAVGSHDLTPSIIVFSMVSKGSTNLTVWITLVAAALN